MGHLFDPAGGEPVVADYLNSYGANETTTSRDLKTWQNGDQIFNTTLQKPQYYDGTNGTSVPADWNTLSPSGSIVGTDVGLTTTGFTKVLSGSDTNTQLAMDTIDDHTHTLVDGGTDVTATATEINNALDGISANVTDTNLNTLTAGTSSNADSLHTHSTLTTGELIASFEKTGSPNTSETLSSFTGGARTAIRFSVRMHSTSSGGGGIWIRINGYSGTVHNSTVMFTSGTTATVTTVTSQNRTLFARWGSVGADGVLCDGVVAVNVNDTEMSVTANSAGYQSTSVGGGKGAYGGSYSSITSIEIGGDNAQFQAGDWVRLYKVK